MSVFGHYARYYNLLYKDKDYESEAKYVHALIQRYASGARTVLELGCGTGLHAVYLSRDGYSIHGVDMSEEMLDSARGYLKKIPSEQANRMAFTHGDIRRIRLGKKFDAVISLFHVMSYQSSNEDIKAAFATAMEHLNPGGVFIFDCWYGPAVLTDRPAVRVKRLEDDVISVVRIAEPVMHPNENVVDVNYHVIIKDKASGLSEEVRESHHMRYLFMPEVKDLFAANDMKMVLSCEWLRDGEPGFGTWGVCFAGKMKK